MSVLSEACWLAWFVKCSQAFIRVAPAVEDARSDDHFVETRIRVGFTVLRKPCICASPLHLPRYAVHRDGIGQSWDELMSLGEWHLNNREDLRRQNLFLLCKTNGVVEIQTGTLNGGYVRVHRRKSDRDCE